MLTLNEYRTASEERWGNGRKCGWYDSKAERTRSNIASQPISCLYIYQSGSSNPTISKPPDIYESKSRIYDV